MSGEVEKCIEAATTLEEIETLAVQFKATPQQSLASKARAMMPKLEERAQSYLQKQDSCCDKTLSFADENEKRNFAYIVSDLMLKNASILAFLNDLSLDRRIQIVSKAGKNANKDKSVFRNYFDFKTSAFYIQSHQVLAINRGEKKKELQVSVELPDQVFEKLLVDYCIKLTRPKQPFLMQEAMSEAYNRLVKARIKRKVRSRLTDKAEKDGLDVFAKNLRELLLTFPCRNSVVMGLDPGFTHGCKLAVIDQKGQVLTTHILYPKNDRLSSKDESFLINCIRTHQVDIIGIGNKTGFGPMEKIISNLIAKHCLQGKVAYTPVNEDGASIYSVSKEASDEFPNADATLISAISLARRLQDPLTEYVKVGPRHLGRHASGLDFPYNFLCCCCC